ncbi:unnamed protein product [Pleuronectes platessa]|uniref:Uncharacterized protein n=1 Tax=Pleuronectes platessa TaxID=8262 RepID=A0A9N7Y4E0_PLEPL|nr:unnamed protein product [Pleuronectes platessa]
MPPLTPSREPETRADRASSSALTLEMVPVRVHKVTVDIREMNQLNFPLKNSSFAVVSHSHRVFVSGLIACPTRAERFQHRSPWTAIDSGLQSDRQTVQHRTALTQFIIEPSVTRVSKKSGCASQS